MSVDLSDDEPLRGTCWPNVGNKDVVVGSVIGTFLPFDLIFTMRLISAKVQLIKKKAIMVCWILPTCALADQRTQEKTAKILYLSRAWTLVGKI